MKREKLSFSHKELILSKLKALKSPISEFSFLDLYLFREKHQYEIIVDQEVFISGISYDMRSYLMPLFEITEKHLPYLKKMLQSTEFLFPVSEDQLYLFKTPDFQVSFNEGDSDYIYKIICFKDYSGRKLQKKRNFVHQFKNNYKYLSQPMDLSNIKDAFLILKTWQKQSKLNENETDYSACLECLTLFDLLPVIGEIHYVDSVPAGFLIGEELTQSVFDFHFAKADHQIKGLYPYMYQNFAQRLWNRYQYLNFEQDLGKEKLRKAKNSFFPEKKLIKYRISLS